MKERQTRYYKIIGFENDLNNLEKALRHCEYLGNIGASRNILLRVDGDGNGRINIEKIDLDINSIFENRPIDKEKYNIQQNNQQIFKSDIAGIYDIGK